MVQVSVGTNSVRSSVFWRVQVQFSSDIRVNVEVRKVRSSVFEKSFVSFTNKVRGSSSVFEKFVGSKFDIEM